MILLWLFVKDALDSQRPYTPALEVYKSLPVAVTRFTTKSTLLFLI